MKTTYKLVGLLLAFALIVAFGDARAQAYPHKPIRFVVGYPPGGSNDIVARLVAPALSERLGQQVVVLNRPGADARIATEYAAKADPDGYTLLIGASGAMSINPGLYAHLPFAYDPVKDFIPITMFASAPMLVAVHPSVPATSMKELMALAKNKPGAMFYSAGSPAMYVATEFFKRQAGVNIVYVPYNGSGPSIKAAISNEIQMVAGSMGTLQSQLRAGKLRALGISGTKRSAIMADIPTMAESGVDFEGGMWVGLFAPAGTPRAIIDRLHSELSVVLKSSDNLKGRLSSLGYETSDIGMSPAEFGAMHKAELVKWTKVIKDLNIRRDLGAK